MAPKHHWTTNYSSDSQESKPYYLYEPYHSDNDYDILSSTPRNATNLGLNASPALEIPTTISSKKSDWPFFPGSALHNLYQDKEILNAISCGWQDLSENIIVDTRGRDHYSSSTVGTRDSSFLPTSSDNYRRRSLDNTHADPARESKLHRSHGNHPDPVAEANQQACDPEAIVTIAKIPSAQDTTKRPVSDKVEDLQSNSTLFHGSFYERTPKEQ